MSDFDAGSGKKTKGSTIHAGQMASTTHQFTGSIYVSGNIYAEEYHVNVMSSSIVYSSGSHKFGDDAGDFQVFTGSVFITGAYNESIASGPMFEVRGGGGDTIPGTRLPHGPIFTVTGGVDGADNELKRVIINDGYQGYNDHSVLRIKPIGQNKSAITVLNAAANDTDNRLLRVMCNPYDAGYVSLHDKAAGYTPTIVLAASNTYTTYFNAGDFVIGSTAATAKFTVNGEAHVTGSILPGADDTHNLGSADYRWDTVYTGDLNLTNDRGSWTVIEEKEYLTITNNKDGKRYKLLMEEIEENK